MPVKYSLIARKNRETGEVMAYANVVPESNTSVDVVTSELTARTTLTRADILATLAGIAEKAAVELADTRTVRLGDLGSLYVTLRSEGSGSAEGFTASLIKGVNIRFRPSKFLRREVERLVTFERTTSKKDAAAARKAAATALDNAIGGTAGSGSEEP